MGLDEPRERGSLTPIEQEGVAAGQELEEFLPTISWPDTVTGCAAVVERLSYLTHALPGVVIGLSLVFFGVNVAYPLYQTRWLLTLA